jgi:hypothetical protein
VCVASARGLEWGVLRSSKGMGVRESRSAVGGRAVVWQVAMAASVCCRVDQPQAARYVIASATTASAPSLEWSSRKKLVLFGSGVPRDAWDVSDERVLLSLARFSAIQTTAVHLVSTSRKRKYCTCRSAQQLPRGPQYEKYGAPALNAQLAYQG